MKYNSLKYYNALVKQKQFDTIILIEKTKKYIDRHYKLKLSSDYLLSKYKLIDYNIKQQVPLLASMIVGILAGFITSYIISFSQLKLSADISPMNRFLFSYFSFIFICAISVVAILFTINKLKALFESNYYNFVAPYEKSVIIEKLKTDYNFECTYHKITIRKNINKNP